ncbi:MAG: hypothetical protein H0V33_05845 [Acidimicrobiia bacterium]|nr:hypothetical protein [Acidimicrobiia bacterium]
MMLFRDVLHDRALVVGERLGRSHHGRARHRLEPERPCPLHGHEHAAERPEREITGCHDGERHGRKQLVDGWSRAVHRLIHAVGDECEVGREAGRPVFTDADDALVGQHPQGRRREVIETEHRVVGDDGEDAERAAGQQAGATTARRLPGGDLG